MIEQRIKKSRRIKSKVKEKFESYICKIICVIFFLICLLLIFFSLRSTGYNPGGDGHFSEDVLFEQDSIFMNILEMGIFVICMGIFIATLDRLFGNRRRVNMILLWIFMLISGIGSLIWVVSLHEYPQADQYFICQVAMQMNAGDFSALQKGGYAAIYQQQLGMITLLRIFFKLFGDMRWIVFQMFNALFVPVIIFGGYQITRVLSKDSSNTERIYLILSFLFIPMYIYSPYVYGEIMSTAFSVIGIWLFLECYAQMRWYKLLGLGLSMGIAVQLRENCIIILIAMVLVALVSCFCGNIKISMEVILASVIGVALLWGIIHGGIYARYIGDDVEGMPASLHIAMGTNDDGVNAGYYNVYNYATFSECDYNAELADQKAKQKLKEFMLYCRENPYQAIDFYARKIEGQWNVPMLQCLSMNGKYNTDAINGIAKKMYMGNLSGYAQNFMNVWQQVVYVFSGILIVVIWNKWKKIEYYLLPVAVIGGFLFSILWEAKARYIFIYMILLIPLAAIGLNDSLGLAHKKIWSKRRKR